MRALFLFRSGRRCVVARVIAEILDELKAALVEWRLVLSASEQAQLRALEDVETCLEVETVAHALTTCALATVDQLEATRLLSGRTTKSWLIEDLYLSKPEAGRRMKFLRFLHGFPLVTAASHAGELSVERVSAVLSLPPAARDAVEGPLVEQARFGSPEDVSDFLDDILTGLGVSKNSDLARERRNGTLGHLRAGRRAFADAPRPRRARHHRPDQPAGCRPAGVQRLTGRGARHDPV
jgi:hypothetical protein